MSQHQEMLFDNARRALATARRNLENDDPNAAVNRAYYAAYYAATAALLSKEEAPRTHKGTHRRFALHFVKEGPLDASTADVLPYAGDARRQADYDAFTVFDETAAIDLISDVEHFVDAVEAMVRRVSRFCCSLDLLVLLDQAKRADHRVRVVTSIEHRTVLTQVAPRIGVRGGLYGASRGTRRSLQGAPTALCTTRATCHHVPGNREVIAGRALSFF